MDRHRDRQTGKLMLILLTDELRKNMAAKENESLTQEYVYLTINQVRQRKINTQIDRQIDR